MRALLAIIAAIVGAVVGFFGAFIVVYPILVAIEGRDMNGGIAMGVGVSVAPALAIIMALLFLVLTLKLIPTKAAPEPEPVTENDPDAAYFQPKPGARTGPDTQTMVAIGVVTLMIIAGVVWLTG